MESRKVRHRLSAACYPARQTEFVETTEQKEALEQIGCLLYQGYLYSPEVDRG